MKVWIAQKYYGWGWENDAVFDTEKKAIDYCMEYVASVEDPEKYTLENKQEDLEDLKNYGYIDGIVAIEELEVQ